MGRPSARSGQRGSARRHTGRDSVQALPPAYRMPIKIVSLISGLVVAVLAVQFAGDATASRMDQWARSTAKALSLPPDVLLLIDFVGEPEGAAVLVGLLAATALLVGRWRLAAVAVVGLGMTGTIITFVLKPVVQRTIHDGHLAYPSGHTATATTLAFVLMLLLVDLLGTGRLAGMLLILGGTVTAAASMALAQVALDAHYLTDTIGGFCTAMVVVPGVSLLADRLTGHPVRPGTCSTGRSDFRR
jgi:membrane-associated phospholipid phosphatase